MELMVIAAVDFAIGWLAWIVIGGIAGALAGMVMKGGGFGILGDIIVGIVGAVIGGVFLRLFFRLNCWWGGGVFSAPLWGALPFALAGGVSPPRTSLRLPAPP